MAVNVRRLLILGALSALLVAVGLLVARTVDLMPEQASDRAVLVDELFRWMLGVATVIFLIVQGALVYAVVRFRRRPGDESDGPPLHGDARLEFIWTLIPAVIVVVIAVYSFRVLAASERPAEAPLIVEVVARQFSWQFRYPGSEVVSEVLHLPVDRPALLRVTSEDVIHSFWVPAFRLKQDATPGRLAEVAVTPIQLGTFPVRCAELCGPAHHAMTTQVIVESGEDFAVWLAGEHARQTGPQDAGTAGRDLFNRYGCQACHGLADAGAAGVLGPSLEDIGESAAGRVPGLSAYDYLRQAIVDPGATLVPGFAAGLMPADFGERLTAQELDLMVRYLLER